MADGPRPSEPQPSVARRIAIGVAGLVLASLFGVALRLIGAGDLWSFLPLAVAVIPLIGISMTAFVNLWIGVPAFMLMAVTPFVAMVAIDVRLVGPIGAGPLATAAPSPWAGGYRFNDAVLRADLAGTFTVARPGRRGATHYRTYSAAPVVGADWQPGHSVAFWAIARGARPPEWSRPLRGLAPLVADDEYDEVVDRVMARRGLNAGPVRLIGRWVADPAEERNQAWGLLARILGGASAAWIVLTLMAGNRPVELGRKQPAQSRSGRGP
jgi:hypothetical protein